MKSDLGGNWTSDEIEAFVGISLFNDITILPKFFTGYCDVRTRQYISQKENLMPDPLVPQSIILAPSGCSEPKQVYFMPAGSPNNDVPSDDFIKTLTLNGLHILLKRWNLSQSGLLKDALVKFTLTSAHYMRHYRGEDFKPVLTTVPSASEKQDIVDRLYSCYEIMDRPGWKSITIFDPELTGNIIEMDPSAISLYQAKHPISVRTSYIATCRPASHLKLLFEDDIKLLPDLNCNVQTLHAKLEIQQSSCSASRTVYVKCTILKHLQNMPIKILCVLEAKCVPNRGIILQDGSTACSSTALNYTICRGNRIS